LILAAPSDTNFLKSLVKNWDVDVADVFPDAYIAGSPERTLQRMVIVDPEEQRFVLEEIAPQAVTRKREIATLLAALSSNGLTRVHPYRPDRQGEVISLWEGRFWQLRTYIPGVLLPRPEYLEDAWRGNALADFLVALRNASAKDLFTFTGESFSIVRFIDDFVEKLYVYRPDLREELSPILDFLTVDFFKQHDTLPVGLCHGDYHPLNMIWSEEAILSVIDWEFCGSKPEAYDLALLIGCLGIEDPLALKGPLVRELLFRVGESGLYHDRSRAYLLELVMALRFAWLSEWLRKNDEEMVRLELDYLTLLLENREKIKDLWNSFAQTHHYPHCGGESPSV
jgi:homoserine kinase type II